MMPFLQAAPRARSRNRNCSTNRNFISQLTHWFVYIILHIPLICYVLARRGFVASCGLWRTILGIAWMLNGILFLLACNVHDIPSPYRVSSSNRCWSPARHPSTVDSSMSRCTADRHMRGQSLVTIVAVNRLFESNRYTVLALTERMLAASLIVISSSM